MEWQPIETAPIDGSPVILGNDYGSWVGNYLERYQSGHKPENHWQAMMLNHNHLSRNASRVPTHWVPLPPPPEDS